MAGQTTFKGLFLLSLLLFPFSSNADRVSPVIVPAENPHKPMTPADKNRVNLAKRLLISY